MNLQVGSSDATGRYRSPEWINLDLVKHDGIDVIGSGLELPFKTGSIDEIHCIHVLEHLTRDKHTDMLSEMCRVLKPGGVCYVETPDFKGTIQLLNSAFDAHDIHAIHIWTTSVYGKNERPGMAHHWGFYEGLLRRAMRSAGFSKVERSTDMISGHYKQEPVLLIRGIK